MRDAARGHDSYQEGIRQFIDEKTYKPVFSPYIGAGEGKSGAVKKSARSDRKNRQKKQVVKSKSL